MQKTKETNVLYHHLGQAYTTLARGEGVYVFDDKGKRYLDAIGGVGVVNIGHGVKEIIETITKQVSTLAYCYSGLVDNTPQQELAAKLQEWAPGGMGKTKTLFSSGGAEANEGALKLAYQYHWERGNSSKYKIIGRWQSYHGNSIGALSMSGRTSWRRMHSPYLLDFCHIPPPYCYRCPWDKSYPGCGMDCAHELKKVIEQEGPENIAAFIAEPVIGTSMSALVPPPEYYPIIRAICDENDVLFIVDEVMSGVGRTGEKWGIDHWKVCPDLITASKGISGGYSPLGALILSEKVWRHIAEGSRTVMHSCTYGGNPLSCATGLAVLNYIEKNDLIPKAGMMGELLIEKLRAALEDVSLVGQVRGRGLFVGVEIVANKETKEPFPQDWKITQRIEEEAFKRGLLILGGVSGLIGGVAGDHFELLPPYVLEEEHVDIIAETVREAIVAVILQLSG
ncbi:MAG: aminotransferase class III-fold pyridoxal phosphate-dependent enzyme [Candidatus Aminicenantes bacterium]|nr:aminotransferase class III-fold pyridoxal phosphate-dependent enzyme [Candidatus Aminicenantes bacterium]